MNSADFWRGVGNFRLHFLSHFFFNFENFIAHLVKISYIFKTPPAFTSRMSKKVAMTIFPLNDIFLGHSVFYTNLQLSRGTSISHLYFVK